jgi:uncharacterized membrane protein
MTNRGKAQTVDDHSVEDRRTVAQRPFSAGGSCGTIPETHSWPRCRIGFPHFRPDVPDPARPVGNGHAAAQARRVVFIDLVRAIAVLFMLYGHTVSALLAPQYQQGTWFDIWQLQRGLTSSLFMLAGGFAFSIATGRHWESHATWSLAVVRRVRRFLLFVLLGYALHLPVSRIVQLPMATPDRWRAFLAVDVLQLLGVTFIAMQLLVLLCRSRRVFTGVALALAMAAVGSTAAAGRTDWTDHVPAWVAPYLSTATGSLFPLFPWSAFVLVGAGLGQIYSRWGAARLPAFATWVLLAPGALLLTSAFVSRVVPYPEFLANPFAVPPREFALRVGPCLILLGAIALASRHITHLPRVFAAVAQESLLIYFVHLCIVYGSPWNRGLWNWYAGALGPWSTLVAVVLVIATMTALAWVWNLWKHTSPRSARVVRWLVGAGLVAPLL